MDNLPRQKSGRAQGYVVSYTIFEKLKNMMLSVRAHHIIAPGIVSIGHFSVLDAHSSRTPAGNLCMHTTQSQIVTNSDDR